MLAEEKACISDLAFKRLAPCDPKPGTKTGTFEGFVRSIPIVEVSTVAP
jgi:hypothetical protein